MRGGRRIGAGRKPGVEGKKVTLALRLPPEINNWLRQSSRDYDKTISALVQEAIIVYLTYLRDKRFR